MFIGLVLVSCFLLQLRSSLFPVSLPLSSKSCLCIFHRSMFVSLFSFEFVAPPPSIWFTLCIVYVWSSCCGYCNIDVLFLTPISCLADNSLAFCLCTMIYMITWLMTSVCLLTTISVCPIKSIFFTLCIWVPLSLPITIRNIAGFMSVCSAQSN